MNAYLSLQWTGCVDVNRPCDTGNAPLHVAINVGNPKIIQLLVNMPDIDVNRVNPECDDATPLHLAALHGKHASYDCTYICYDCTYICFHCTYICS